MSQESPRIYSTGEVASRLGVSTSLLRRYGLAWERVQGERLPQLPGLGRLYPEDVVENLLEAHAWIDLRPEASVEEALRAVLGQGVAQGVSAEVAEAVQASVQRTLAPLLAELHALKSELRGLHARLEAAPAAASAAEVAPARPTPQTEPASSQPTSSQPTSSEDGTAEDGTAEDVALEPASAAPRAERSGVEAASPAEADSDFFGASARQGPDLPQADWDFSLQGPPVPKTKAERKGYPPEPWPAPWRVQPRPDEESTADFEALEEDLADERERDEDDKGFVNWFKRNF